MNPGIELDLLVAEKIFKWEWQEIPKHIHIVGHDAAKDDKVLMPPNATFPPYFEGQDMLFYHAAVPAFSTSLKDAWRVVDFMREKDYSFGLSYFEEFKVSFTESEITINEGGEATSYVVQSVTLEYAICLAALNAVGYNV